MFCVYRHETTLIPSLLFIVLEYKSCPLPRNLQKLSGKERVVNLCFEGFSDVAGEFYAGGEQIVEGNIKRTFPILRIPNGIRALRSQAVGQNPAFVDVALET